MNFRVVDWFYVQNGKQIGPVPAAQFEDWVRAGGIAPETLVWREGMAEWQPYGRVRPVPAPVEPGSGTGRKTCALCSESFAPDEMISFEGAWVCAACKPRLVQRVREGLSVGLASGNAWRDGDLVVTISGSTLTGRCVKCNGVESLAHTPTTLYWHPRWLYGLFVDPAAWFLTRLPTRKRSWVAVSVCYRCRSQLSAFSAASWLIQLIVFGIGLAAVVYSSLVLLVIAATVLAASVIAYRLLWAPVSAAKIEGDYLWLRGCGREFVDALPEFNQQRTKERQKSAEPPNRKT